MKRWISIIVPVIFLVSLIGWRLQQRLGAGAAEGGPRGGRAPVVSVEAVQTRDIVSTFEAVGDVESPFNVELSPKVSGRLEYLVVREGDRVTEGQVLARIDTSELEASLAEKRAAVAQARSRLAQAAATEGATNASVASDIRQEQAAVATAEATYQQSRSTSTAETASAEAGVTEARGRLASAEAAIENARATVRSAEANLANARARFERVRGLYQQGFTAAQDVDDARTQVSVEEGDLDVARGQVAAAIANRDAAAAQMKSAQERVRIARAKGTSDVAAARAGVQRARAGLSAARANTAQGPAYRQNLAALRAAVEAAEAQARNTEAQLRNTVLISPVDGFVTARHMDPGAMASPSQPVLAVQALRQIYVSVPVPEEVNRQVYPGKTATVTFDALPGASFTGRVASVNAAADVASRQFTMRLLLDNPENRIKPGMFARVSMVTQRARQAPSVPREAVQQTADGSRVIVVNTAGEETTAEHRPVSLGIGDARYVAVKTGLAPGEKVVTVTAMDLRDGQPVRLGGEGGSGAAGRQGRPGGQSGQGAREGRG